MKLILQIALGVFLGTLASQFAIDGWRTRQQDIANESAEKLRAGQEKIRLEQGQRIRALLLQRRQGHIPDTNKPPAGFAPGDPQMETFKEK
jgi:hypothetical protein